MAERPANWIWSPGVIAEHRGRHDLTRARRRTPVRGDGNTETAGLDTDDERIEAMQDLTCLNERVGPSDTGLRAKFVDHRSVDKGHRRERSGPTVGHHPFVGTEQTHHVTALPGEVGDEALHQQRHAECEPGGGHREQEATSPMEQILDADTPHTLFITPPRPGDHRAG